MEPTKTEKDLKKEVPLEPKRSERERKEFERNLSQEEQEELKSRVSELLAKGRTEIEAKQEALNSMIKDHQTWSNLTKQVGLPDFLDDQIRRALGVYLKLWNKDPNNKDQTLQFALNLRKNRNQGGVIASVSLELEMRRNGLAQVLRHKQVDFTHVSQIRKEHEWKTALYEAMLHDIICFAMTYFLHLDDFRNGKFDQPTTDKPSDTAKYPRTPDEATENKPEQAGPNGEEIHSGVGDKS